MATAFLVFAVVDVVAVIIILIWVRLPDSRAEISPQLNQKARRDERATSGGSRFV
jgi:hypothetical protein